MKAVILAGGLGSRISEESYLKPKPMIEIGGKPILWHIMKMYSQHGINDFIICLGYKGYIIKEYFSNYFLHTSDVTFSLRDNSTEIHNKFAEPWKITLIDTGDDTMTGGRLKRVSTYIGNETFCLTYGDGVSDIDITKLITHHKASGRQVTVTAIQPPGRFGAMEIKNDKVINFQEKLLGDDSWINGGFFVLEPDVIKRIHNDDTIWEQEPLKELASEGQLSAFLHKGFWHPMDTLREKNHLEELWSLNKAPWKSW
jgi:glucose-1-phosphate cytidylyltransferase